MKTLIATLFATTLVACADPPVPSSTASAPLGNSPYESNRIKVALGSVPANSPLRKWSTAQLQQRRLDLYKTVPYRQNRHGNPVFIYHGDTLPQQDEIFAIEAELNRRYQAGDKSAELLRPIPGVIHGP